MANIDAILKYQNDPNDNYYSILGCSQLSTDTAKAIEARISQESANGATSTQPAEIGKENPTHSLEKKPHRPSLEHSTSRRHNVEQIMTEYKTRALLYHPDKNPNDPESAKKFAKLQIAKDILTSEESRMKYDKWLNSGLAMPFEVWTNQNSHVYSSLHWANPKPKSMIEPTKIDTTKENPKLNLMTSQNTSSLLQKFRNYEI